MIVLTAWLWGWNAKVSGMRLVFSFWAVCSANCRLGAVVARLIDRKRIATFIEKLAHGHWFRKNQSRHYIHDRNCGKGMEFFWNSQLNLSSSKTLNYFQTILRLVLSFRNLHLFHSNATETQATFWSAVHFKPMTNLELSNALAHNAKLVLSFTT